MTTNNDHNANDSLTSLNALLRRTASSQPLNLSQSDLQLIPTSLSSSNRETKSISLIILSKWSNQFNPKYDNSKDHEETHRPSSQDLIPTLRPFLLSTFSEDRPPEEYIPFTCLISHLYPLHPATCTDILTTSTFESEAGKEDALSVLLEAAELPSSLQLALAEMFVHATSTKSGRELIRSRALDWLKGGMTMGSELGVLCSVSLAKLSSADRDIQPTSTTTSTESDNLEIDDVEICERMISLIQSSPSSSSILSETLEGISILSLRPHIKNLLSHNDKFLKSLISLSPIPTPKGGSLPLVPRGEMNNEVKSDLVDSGICYGITTILVNLTNPKRNLTEEEEQIKKLRSMAVGKKVELELDPMVEMEMVKERTKKVIDNGVVNALSGLIRAESKLVKENLGRLCLNLVEDVKNRSLFLKDGGYKVLSSLIRDLIPPSLVVYDPSLDSSTNTKAQDSQDKSTSLTNESTLKDEVNENVGLTNTNHATTKIVESIEEEYDIIPAIQAMAKMIITTPPQLLFTPPYQTTSLDAISPLCRLLLESNTLLQFESLMGLTNLSSISTEHSTRIFYSFVFPSHPSKPSHSSSLPSLSQNDPPSSDQIQRKNSTNYSSARQNGSGKESSGMFSSPVTPTRILTKIEELTIDHNTLIRRAATQLVCNLVSCEKAFEAWSGEDGNFRSKERLNILAVLSNGDDLSTRLAAGGALAILTESRETCKRLLVMNGRNIWERVWEMMGLEYEEDGFDSTTEMEVGIENPNENREGNKTEKGEKEKEKERERENEQDEGLILRAIVIILNLLNHVVSLSMKEQNEQITQIRKTRMEDILKKLMSEKTGDISDSAQEALNILGRLGST
ncbi:hypothetical protein M231_03011 [Tremella mesenterica]|uniref:UNC-45/Cro1/She4 central domain-containing protein n=1 Tax=Tremella mesenterica TaxID=5217 RepID=A0A4V1M4A2_TREME|nr:uncharacterized protein TREMEDRAFT_65338 [Tremella mesenterica DSM 1558]EIW66476.1 hypothetical protein TREMEDRAFT_65338 [Tremella mesenterica DSM 1558]RXK39657.1 hypothetical protein M231_03011 [Tremella mesenterica]